MEEKSFRQLPRMTMHAYYELAGVRNVIIHIQSLGDAGTIGSCSTEPRP